MAVLKGFDKRIGGNRDAQRVRQNYRRLKRAQFLDLRVSGQLPKAVPDRNRSRDFVLEEVAGTRETAVTPVLTLSPFYDRDVTDRHARNIGDGIARSGSKDSQAEPKLPGPGPLAFGVQEQRGAGNDENQACEKLHGTISKPGRAPTLRQSGPDPLGGHRQLIQAGAHGIIDSVGNDCADTDNRGLASSLGGLIGRLYQHCFNFR